MQTLKTTNDNRVTYDTDTGAVRSFFGTDLVEPATPSEHGAAAAAVAAAPDPTRDFLSANTDAFKLAGVSLARVDERKGSVTSAVTYQQHHNGIPVFGGKLVVGVEESSKRVASAVNTVDYALPADLAPAAVRIPADAVAELVRTQLSLEFGHVKTGSPSLFVYRCVETTAPEMESTVTRDNVERAKSLGRGVPGQAYLAWQVPADTSEPNGKWEVFIDAVSGELIQVKDRHRYASVKGFVFLPDPITSSGNPALSSATAASTLEGERREVDIDNLDPPNGSTFHLNGRWVESRDIESPDFDVPSTTTDFKFSAGDRRFLSVMAYFWLDRLIHYLHQFGVVTFNTAVDSVRIGVDAQGLDLADNSHFTTDLQGRPYIAFGEGGVPDAADAHVVVHEYGHALHFFMSSNQNDNGSEEGFGDFLGGAFLDRFNTGQFQRESVFPWDNNAGDQYSVERFFNTTRKFSDANFNQLGIHTKGSVLAATLWELFLSLGGNSTTPAGRARAADRVVHIYMEALVSLADESSYRDIGRALVQADSALHGGANRAAIQTAFANRGAQLN